MAAITQLSPGGFPGGRYVFTAKATTVDLVPITVTLTIDRLGAVFAIDRPPATFTADRMSAEFTIERDSSP